MNDRVRSKKFKEVSGFKRKLAWVGSVFLFFVTPTAASTLWEKWLDEMDAKKKRENEPPKPPLD